MLQWKAWELSLKIFPEDLSKRFFPKDFLRRFFPKIFPKIVSQRFFVKIFAEDLSLGFSRRFYFSWRFFEFSSIFVLKIFSEEFFWIDWFVSDLDLTWILTFLQNWNKGQVPQLGVWPNHYFPRWDGCGGYVWVGRQNWNKAQCLDFGCGKDRKEKIFNTPVTKIRLHAKKQLPVCPRCGLKVCGGWVVGCA